MILTFIMCFRKCIKFIHLRKHTNLVPIKEEKEATQPLTFNMLPPFFVTLSSYRAKCQY